MGTTVETDKLTPRQEERRRRVIQAALQLGAQGGYDAVQMRDVAETADVALGTIYRYFSSKDHLLAAAMVEWTSELQSRVARTPPTGETAADKMVEVLRRACRGLERQPLLAAALVRALGSPDQRVAEAARQVTGQIDSLAEGVIAHIEPAIRDDITSVIRHVWYSNLIGWANGRFDIKEVGDELERATRLLLACHDSSSDGSAGGNGGRSDR